MFENINIIVFISIFQYMRFYNLKIKTILQSTSNQNTNNFYIDFLQKSFLNLKKYTSFLIRCHNLISLNPQEWTISNAVHNAAIQ